MGALWKFSELWVGHTIESLETDELMLSSGENKNVERGADESPLGKTQRETKLLSGLFTWYFGLRFHKCETYAFLG